MPHVTPIWFVLDGDDVIFTTAADTVKGRTLRRDPRACHVRDDQEPPFAYVLIEGTCDISEDLDEMLVRATRLGGRYMGGDRAEEFGRRNAVPGELLVRLTPTKTIAAGGLAVTGDDFTVRATNLRGFRQAFVHEGVGGVPAPAGARMARDHADLVAGHRAAGRRRLRGHRPRPARLRRLRTSGPTASTTSPSHSHDLHALVHDDLGHDGRRRRRRPGRAR